MAKALYQKYRSQTFDELIGQEHISKILKNAVKQKSFSHAYLFIGSRGTGKTSTARILAKAINCEHPTKDGNPCNKCDNCVSITNGSFLDLIEIDAASNRGIDQIRALKEKIEFSPTIGKYKIYIIDEVHMLTNEAFNALLKTLEEPPVHAIFMLATTEAHKVPATIVSRCQRYDFRLGSDEEIKHVIQLSAKNEGVKLAIGAVKLLTQNARGSYRDALSLLDVVIAGQIEGEHPTEVTEEEVRIVLGLPDTTMVYYFLEKLVYGEGQAALQLIEELDSKGVNLQHFVRSSIEVLRQILVKQIQGKIRETEYSFAYELDRSQILLLLNLFINADKNLKSAVIPALVLEMIIPQVSFSNPTKHNTLNTDKLGGGEEVGKMKTSKTSQETKVQKGLDPLKSVKREKLEKDAVAINVTAHVTASPAEDIAKTDEVKVKEGKKEDMKENVEMVSQPNLNEKPEKIHLTLEQIEAKWKEVTNQIKEANGHLFAFLQAANLKSFEDGVLVMQVAFEFHKERIEAIKSREAILTLFEKIYGVKFLYKCEVNNQIKVRKQVGPEIILSHNAIEVNSSVTQNQDGVSQPQNAAAPVTSLAGTTNQNDSEKDKATLTQKVQEDAQKEENKKKFAFKRGLGRDVEELFAGL